MSCTVSSTLPFDRDKWIVGDYRVRGEMVVDLIRDRRLEGQKRDDVVAKLGEPNHSEEEFIKYDVDLGVITERWLQKNYLVISFDKNNTVTSAVLID